MITFTLGASAAIVVGAIVWLIISVITIGKKVKQSEEEIRNIWLDIQHRCDSIEHNLDHITTELSGRIEHSHQYTDSRLDKMSNHFERVLENNYVSKKNKMDNSIEYNN